MKLAVAVMVAEETVWVVAFYELFQFSSIVVIQSISTAETIVIQYAFLFEEIYELYCTYTFKINATPQKNHCSPALSTCWGPIA